MSLDEIVSELQALDLTGAPWRVTAMVEEATRTLAIASRKWEQSR